MTSPHARLDDARASHSRVRPRGGPPGSRARCPPGGFSLLEVLVAFVIVALVVTALFRLFGGALGNAAAADDWTRAVLVAQSRLELAASTQPLVPATDAGTDADGRIAWRTAVLPYVPPDANPDLERMSASLPTQLYQVTVDVTFPGVAGRDRSLTLSTVKIGPRNPG